MPESIWNLLPWPLLVALAAVVVVEEEEEEEEEELPVADTWALPGSFLGECLRDRPVLTLCGGGECGAEEEEDDDEVLAE